METPFIMWAGSVLFSATAAYIGIKFHSYSGRAAASLLSLAGAIFSFAVYASVATSLVDVFILGVSVVAFINAARLIANHYEVPYLKRFIDDTSEEIFVAIFILALLKLIEDGIFNTFSDFDFTILLPVAIIAIAVLLFLTTLINYTKYKIRSIDTSKDNSSPSVTLAIPARNETHALRESLDKAIALDYPKLEILVLDDCSQDHTPEVIKSYAQKGVRFIQGEQPATGWLGKNHAYEALSKQASGEYILFMGVDVHLEKHSLDRIVEVMSGGKLEMISVLPRREHFDLLANFLQPMRYFWQLSVPHFFKGRPPVISSVWMVKRTGLKSRGGFASLKNAIIPESYFARHLARNNKYGFFISDKGLGISTRKRIDSQIETATRTLYPLVHRQLMASIAGFIGILLVFVAPFASPLLIALYGMSLTSTLLLISAVMLMLNHLLITLAVSPKSWWLSFINFPIGMTVEAFTLIRSMLLYEFSEVDWKGRNVCVPVMKPEKPTS